MSVEGALATYCKNNMDVMVECSSFYKTMDNCKAKFPEGKCANKLNSMLTCMNNIPCATHKAWNDVIMECYQKKDTATCDAENPRPCDAQINAYEACAGVIWWW